MLSLVVPVYNEEKRFELPLPRVVQYLQEHFPKHEVIYVDDGSSDQTYRRILETAKKNPSIRVVQNARNMGKGEAVRHGFSEAHGDVLVFSDADFSSPVEEIDHLWKVMQEGFDVAIGSRGLPQSNVEVHQAWTRELMGKTFNAIIRTFLPIRIHDTQCGFKMFRRSAADIIVPRMTIHGFAFDVEMLVIAQIAGLKIAEVPVTWRNVLDSRVHPIRNSLEMLRDVLKIRGLLKDGKYRKQ